MNRQKLELWLFPKQDTIKLEYDHISTKKFVLLCLGMIITIAICETIQTLI